MHTQALQLDRPFKRNLALVVGIDAYRHVPRLTSAVHDARVVARTLRELHDYEVDLCLNEEATLAGLRERIRRFVKGLTSEDRALFYFAGHGVTHEVHDPVESSTPGPILGDRGFFVPQDASRSDSGTFLPMQEVYRLFQQIPCRHFLIVLDCCFAGAFSPTRSVTLPARLYYERLVRWVREGAWQLLASAAFDERALDVLDGEVIGARSGGEAEHSPFASAFLAALQGDSDANGDGVLLAAEIFVYIENQFGKIEANTRRTLQSPRLEHLPQRGKGQFFFCNPRRLPSLPSAVALDAANNPYRGLSAYERADRPLFFGRDAVLPALLQSVAKQALTVVLGVSGAGKSSLVKAGLIPRLEETGWRVLGPLRPGLAPVGALCRAFSVPDIGPAAGSGALARLTTALAGAAGSGRTVLVVDQLEEVLTQCTELAERRTFLSILRELLERSALHIVATLRSDFEPHFSEAISPERWLEGRYPLPALKAHELRTVIEEPADRRELHFEPESLIERLVEEVGQMPGALPLLSFTLSEMYMNRLRLARSDRALTQEDYDTVGGVVGSLRNRLEATYRSLPGQPLSETDPQPTQQTMRRVLLRMTVVEGGEVARRRVPLSELDYGNEAENQRVAGLVGQLTEARLLVCGRAEGGRGQIRAFVEPAHDAVVRSWDRISDWAHGPQGMQLQDELALQRRVAHAMAEWRQAGEPHELLWDRNARLHDALELLNTNPLALNRAEREFIRRSAQRQRTVRWRTRAIVSGVITALAVLTVLAWLQRSKAEENATQAQENAKKASESAERAKESQRQESEAKDLAIKASDKADQARVKAVAAEKKAEERLVEAQAAQHRAQTAQRSVQDQLLLTEAAQRASSDPTSAAHRLARISSARLTPAWHALAMQVSQQPLSRMVLRGHRGRIVAARLTPDGQSAVSVGEDGRVVLWHMTTASPRVLAELGREPQDLAIAPSGKLAAVALVDGSAQLFDLEGARPPTELRRQRGTVRSIAFNSGSDLLATAASDGYVAVWRTSGSPLLVHSFHVLEGLRSVSFSPDGSMLAATSDQGSVILISTKNWKQLRHLSAHRGVVDSAEWSDSGRFLATRAGRGHIVLWSIPTGAVITRQQHFGPFGTGYLRSGQKDTALLLSAPRTRTFQLTSISAGESAPQFSPQLGSDLALLSLAPHGEFVFSATADHQARLWRRSSFARPVLRLIGHSAELTDVQFSKNGASVLTADAAGEVRIWRTRPIGPYYQLSEPEERFRAARLSPDGCFAALTYEGDGTKPPLVTSLGVAQLHGCPTIPHRETVLSMPGIAVVGNDGRVAFEADRGEPLNIPATLSGRGPILVQAQPSSDPDRSGLTDVLIRLENREHNAEPVLITAQPCDDAVRSVDVSADGEIFLVTCGSGTVKTWLARELLHEQLARATRFSCLPDTLRSECAPLAHARRSPAHALAKKRRRK
jgi:WD40 repeat protein